MNKKVKIILLISGLIVLLCLILYWLMFHVFYLFDPGIDIFCRPHDYYGTSTRIDSDGYLHMTSEKAVYDAQETMELNIQSAYYKTMEDAEQAEEVWGGVFHSDYFEIEFVGADETETIADVDGDMRRINDWQTYGIYKQFDPDDLVIQPKGLGSRVTRESLSHSVTVLIDIKEDAPESFEETLMIYVGSDLMPWKTYINAGTTCVVFVTVVRDGDTVKLYPAKDADLGKLNYH